MAGLVSLASFFVRLASWGRNILYDREWLRSRKPPLLTISVGNISFGGTGKTPLAIFLLSWLQEKGWRPCLISRGYHGKWEKGGGVVSDGEKILASWEEAGDEPYMVASALPGIPVLVGRNRYLSSLQACKLGCRAAVLDDAFQHRQIKRDLDIVLLRPQDKPQREGWKALRRADVILFQDKDKQSLLSPQRWIKAVKTDLPIFTYELSPSSVYLLSSDEAMPPEMLKGKRVVAFCGLASPQSFRRSLEELGASLLSFITFPDHFPYPDPALKILEKQFNLKKPDLVLTTEKDAVKLSRKKWFIEVMPLAILRIKFVAEPGFHLFLQAFLDNLARKEGHETNFQTTG